MYVLSSMQKVKNLRPANEEFEDIFVKIMFCNCGIKVHLIQIQIIVMETRPNIEYWIFLPANCSRDFQIKIQFPCSNLSSNYCRNVEIMSTPIVFEFNLVY